MSFHHWHSQSSTLSLWLAFFAQFQRDSPVITVNKDYNKKMKTTEALFSIDMHYLLPCLAKTYFNS